MLVLVLILVVIALVLLLAGWFLHLVVLAWTSVGISVLAGLVLLYDWWQTRSAVRAGRQGSGGLRDGDGDRDRAAPHGAVAAGAVGAGAVGAGAAGAMGAGPDGHGGPDMEPATQVLPVVPPSANAADDTVVMPVVAPSGSSEAPSGESRSSGSPSRSVTDAGAEEPGTTRAVGGDTPAGDPAAGQEPGGGGDPASGSAPPAESRPDRVREANADAAGAARTPDAKESATTGQAGERPDGATQAVRASDGGPGATAAGGAAAAGGAVAGGAAAAAVAGSGAGSGVSSGAGEEPASVGAAGGGAPLADDRSRAGEEADPSGEAPEEPRDPAHAALVARLPDEVIVIDEHPRYHVQGCRSLPGQPLIPLPVSEAVELGFTPCGWCTPNRVLSERNPAEAR